ncbi:AEC family transporter [Geobacter sp.]|uniref:AEC family transporter n=1 Tax=Geobacter sp. TaxID=46610 RepID=UPI0026046715|nr:AEC family transporter [Geobacter sp.]
MANIILLIVCFAAGMILRRTGRFPESTPAALNGFIIHVSLPAVALLHIHSLRLDLSLVYTAAMAWLLFGAAWLLFRPAGRFLGLSRETVGALILVGGLGNTSFVGLPMIEAFYGKEFLGVGLIADQLGSFLVLSTLGILTATLHSAGDLSARQIVRKILYFPPFQALILAFLLRPVPFHPWAVTVLQKVGDTLTPLALASVGFQLQLAHMKGELRPLSLGLCYKLLLAPALAALLFVALCGARGKVIQVTIFEAAMAPMISAGIIAVDHRLNPPLVSLMIGIGIPLSFLTLTGWWWLLQRV